MRELTDRDYWTPADILTRNAMFNMTIGGRGRGKTFGSLRYCVRQYLKKGWTFIYLRRYESEFKKKDKLLSGVSVKFPGHEFRVDGMRLQVRPVQEGDEKARWETMGYLVQLSTALTEKGVPYDDVHTIIFDEFLVPKGFLRYLPNEVEAFLDFYNTVDRFNDRVRVLFLANSVNIINPYFRYFGLHPRKDTRWASAMEGYVCLQCLDASGAFVASAQGSRFGRMIAQTEYYDYAIGNQFRDDTTEFLEPKPSTARYRFAIVFDGQALAIWHDVETAMYYASARVPKDATPYALTKADMQPDMQLVAKSSPMLKSLTNVYRLGLVRFDSVGTRTLFFDLLDYLNVY